MKEEGVEEKEEKRGRSGVVVDFTLRQNIVAGPVGRGCGFRANSASGQLDSSHQFLSSQPRVRSGRPIRVQLPVDRERERIYLQETRGHIIGSMALTY